MRFLWVVFVLMNMLITPSASAQQALVRSVAESQADTSITLALDQVFLERLWSYLAVAYENGALCKTNFCKNKFKNIIDTRYIGEGRCDAIKHEGFTKELCFQVKKDACESQQDVVQKTMCSAVMSGDMAMVPRVKEAMNDAEQTIEDVAEALGIIAGYRHKDISACERYIMAYVKEEIPSYYVCSILFSSNSEDAYKKARNDLKNFIMAKEKKDSQICWKIGITAVRNKCFENMVQPLF